MWDGFCWPSRRDQLFSGDASDWHQIACLDTFDHDPVALAFSYAEACVYLCKEAPKTGNQDFFVYPAVFLGRHALELMLKSLLLALGSLHQEDPPKDAYTSHKLMDLWNDVKPQLNALGITDDSETETHFERSLSDLHKIDPRSFTFRYRTDNKGRLSLPSSLDRIALDKFSLVLCGLMSYLNAAYDAVDQFRSTGS